MRWGKFSPVLAAVYSWSTHPGYMSIPGMALQLFLLTCQHWALLWRFNIYGVQTPCPGSHGTLTNQLKKLTHAAPKLRALTEFNPMNIFKEALSKNMQLCNIYILYCTHTHRHIYMVPLLTNVSIDEISS